MAVSIVTYTGDGSTTQYVITFEYISRDDVVVTIDDVAATFTFVNDTTLEFSSAPATNAKIVIKRGTPSAPLVDFTDGSTLFEADLDLAHQQSRYLAEEARDIAEDAKATVDANIDDVLTVASIATDVTKVAAIDSNVTTVANNNTNVTTVAGIDSDVTTVAGIAPNVTTVANNDANVTITATNIADVNTVAGIDANVTTVAGISGNVTTVANNDANVTTVATNDANITTVAGISGNVTTVANNDANVTAVAGNATDISTVAGINTSVSTVAANNTNVTTAATGIANINTVAGNITNVNNVGTIDGDVTTVAGISSAVTTVSGIASDVSTVSTNNANVSAVGNSIASVNTTAGSIANVNTVAGDIANVNTAATDIANINTAATNISQIQTVATAITDVSTVSSDIAAVITAANDLNEAVSEIETVAASILNVDTVGTNITNVNTVAGVSSDVTTVAGNTTNINTVAGNDANITTVAGISGNVSTVAGISSDVTTVAADATDIGAVATNIASVNSVGGSISNVNTVATNINNINDFADIYRVGATDPSTNNDNGDLFYNTTAGVLKVYNASTSAWEQGVTAGSGFLPLTGGQLTGNLTFSGSETVDGRDISTDGTKLDTIETNADVTDAANVEPLVDSHLNVSGATNGQYLGWNGTDYAWSTVDLSTKLDLAGGTMTGAINFVSGQTFDGRDVSADGTKLDGIEAGATADQTKADIDALGINAATLDGVDSSQFLRSDTSDTMTGVLTVDNELSIVNGNGSITLWNWGNGNTNYIRGQNTTVDTPVDHNQDVTFKGGAHAIHLSNHSDIRSLSGNWTGEYAGKMQYHDNSWYIQYSNQFIVRDSGGTNRFTVSSGGNGEFGGDLTVHGGDIVLNGTGRIQGVDTVSSGTDAANKNYVDTAVASAGVSYASIVAFS